MIRLRIDGSAVPRPSLAIATSRSDGSAGVQGEDCGRVRAPAMRTRPGRRPLCLCSRPPAQAVAAARDESCPMTRQVFGSSIASPFSFTELATIRSLLNLARSKGVRQAPWERSGRIQWTPAGAADLLEQGDELGFGQVDDVRLLRW